MSPIMTGSTLGDFETLTRHGSSSSSTTIRSVPDPGLRAALDIFKVVATEPMAPLRGYVRANDRPQTQLYDDSWMTVPDTTLVFAVVDDELLDGVRFLTAHADLRFDLGWLEIPDRHRVLGGSADAVSTMQDLKSRLGLPMSDVLTAAGVSRSTFYSWRDNEECNPRVSSQGRLWALAQFVEDIEDLVDVPLLHWLGAQEHRRALLRTGRFDDLI